jgi:multidrug efflux pump subunit AcrA (membrane-fusion protein)
MLMKEPVWQAATQALRAPAPGGVAQPEHPPELGGAALAAALQAPRLALAATAACTEMAARLGCRRVALGWRRGLHWRVVALSHGEAVEGPAGLSDVLDALAECGEQGAALRVAGQAPAMSPAAPADPATPPTASRTASAVAPAFAPAFAAPAAAAGEAGSAPAGLPHITQAHRALLRGQALAGVMGVPLVDRQQVCGALLCEREDRPFTALEEQALLEAAAWLAPVLALRTQVERSTAQRLRDGAGALALRWRDPSQRLLRWGAGAALVGLVGLAAWPLPQHLGAPARLEGAVQRVMGAPQDGYLREVHVRPGDPVKAGQVLAEMADEELQLARRARQGELAQHENAFAEAFSRGDRVQAAQAQAKAAEARAALALAEQQLARSRLVAPFDGVVLAGDLTRQLGAPLKRGETLMTLAPDARFRVVLEVAERDVAELRIGQAGQLRLSARPQQPIALRVLRITPVAHAVEGAVRYDVEAEPLQAGSAADLRPGLQGVARIELPAEPLAVRWGRRAWGAVRYALWAW